MRKRFWLDVAKVVIAMGSLLATLATVANAGLVIYFILPLSIQ